MYYTMSFNTLLLLYLWVMFRFIIYILISCVQKYTAYFASLYSVYFNIIDWFLKIRHYYQFGTKEFTNSLQKTYYQNSVVSFLSTNDIVKYIFK